MANENNLRKELLKQLLTFSTAAFGFVAALAWNEFIQSSIEVYIKPYVGNGSGVISKGIYALAITILAVFITYTLTKLVKKN